MNIKKVCVVGAGFMGRQIAMNTAMYDFQVTLTDPIESTLKDSEAWGREYLEGRVQKGRLTQEQADQISSRLRLVSDLSEAAQDCDLVIEAIIEKLDIKRDLFQELGKIVREDTILATNSSHLVSSLLADCVPNPARLLNLHYFSPAIVMKLVEIVQGEHTGPEAVQAMVDFCIQTGKEPVVIKKEIEGFIVNRIVMAIQREARFLVDGDYCSYQDLDKAVELGLNHPLGPFRFMDFVGLELCLIGLEDEYRLTGEKPAYYNVIKELVEQGRTGRSAGKGFYDY